MLQPPAQGPRLEGQVAFERSPVGRPPRRCRGGLFFPPRGPVRAGARRAWRGELVGLAPERPWHGRGVTPEPIDPVRASPGALPGGATQGSPPNRSGQGTGCAAGRGELCSWFRGDEILRFVVTVRGNKSPPSSPRQTCAQQPLYRLQPVPPLLRASAQPRACRALPCATARHRWLRTASPLRLCAAGPAPFVDSHFCVRPPAMFPRWRPAPHATRAAERSPHCVSAPPRKPPPKQRLMGGRSSTTPRSSGEGGVGEGRGSLQGRAERAAPLMAATVFRIIPHPVWQHLPQRRSAAGDGGAEPLQSTRTGRDLWQLRPVTPSRSW